MRKYVHYTVHFVLINTRVTMALPQNFDYFLIAGK
jgi:hypothetical protein